MLCQGDAKDENEPEATEVQDAGGVMGAGWVSRLRGVAAALSSLGMQVRCSLRTRCSLQTRAVAEGFCRPWCCDASQILW